MLPPSTGSSAILKIVTNVLKALAAGGRTQKIIIQIFTALKISELYHAEFDRNW
jgi:hypothetical protein